MYCPIIETLNLLSPLCLSFFYFPLSQLRKKFYIYVLRGLKKDDEEAAAIENDWKFAAMVLDRSSFYYFLEIALYLFNEKLLLPPH